MKINKIKNNKLKGNDKNEKRIKNYWRKRNWRNEN